MIEKIKWKLIEWLGGGTIEDYISRREFEEERMRWCEHQSELDKMYPDRIKNLNNQSRGETKFTPKDYFKDGR